MKIFNVLKGAFYLITHQKDENVQWDWHMALAKRWLNSARTYENRHDKVMEEFCLEHVRKHYDILTDIRNRRRLRQTS